jgi:hypothetical protein
MQHDHSYSIYIIPLDSLSFRLYNLPLAQIRPKTSGPFNPCIAPFPTHPDVPFRSDLLAVKGLLIPLTGLELFHPRLVHGLT